MGYGNILSASALSVFRECPRCFWMEKNEKVKRPRGVFPSLPGGMDRILKDRFDFYRAGGAVPPEMEGRGFSLFKNDALLAQWRNWRRGLRMDIAGWELMGAVDDLVVDDDGFHHVFDYKTRGSAPKEGQTELYYGGQADIYRLLLEKVAKLKMGDRGLFAYYFPTDSAELFTGETCGSGEGFPFLFDCEVVEIETSADRAEDFVMKAIECLRGNCPPRSLDCEYCSFKDAK